MQQGPKIWTFLRKLFNPFGESWVPAVIIAFVFINVVEAPYGLNKEMGNSP